MPFDDRGQALRLEALDKIRHVIELLRRKDRWCKRSLRTDDGRLCILGAVRESEAELLLYAPILRAIRETTGHSYRKIEAFNDSWLTSHALVLDVLAQAERNLAGGVTAGSTSRGLSDPEI